MNDDMDWRDGSVQRTLPEGVGLEWSRSRSRGRRRPRRRVPWVALVALVVVAVGIVLWVENRGGRCTCTFLSVHVTAPLWVVAVGNLVLGLILGARARVPLAALGAARPAGRAGHAAERARAKGVGREPGGGPALPASSAGRRRRLRAVVARLDRAYGRPRSRRASRLSASSSTRCSRRTPPTSTPTAPTPRCAAGFPTWSEVRDAPVAQVEQAIALGGLSHVKAPRIGRSCGR